MEITKERLKQDLDHFNDEQLKQVAEFMEFLKFQARLTAPAHNISQFADLYREFAQDDRTLAEVGIADYAEHLAGEDQA
jgi:predicted alpha/beta-fold hydrolase